MKNQLNIKVVRPTIESVGQSENMTSDELINLVVPALISEVKSKAYTTSDVSDAEVLGLIVSKFNKWDRGSILETTVEALTDSNFHQDAEEVTKLQGVQ